MFKVGIVGWRGMVGYVLIQRMHEENDFESIDANFFSTSQSGEKVNILNSQESSLLDAFDIDELLFELAEPFCMVCLYLLNTSKSK